MRSSRLTSAAARQPSLLIHTYRCGRVGLAIVDCCDNRRAFPMLADVRAPCTYARKPTLSSQLKLPVVAGNGMVQ